MRYRWLLGLALLLFAVPVAAQSGPSLRWAQYDNIVEIGSDGEIAISEQQQIVVDQGPLRRMTRTFELAGAQIGTVEVLEDGAPYRRDTNEAPGTFNATTDGANANIRVFFRNPNADRHNLELRYTLRNALVAPDTTQALLDWRFFWGDNAPPVENGSIEVRFPAAVNDAFQFNVAGASVDQTASGNSVRWQLTDQIQGQQVRVEAAFPQSILNAGITLRAPGSGVVAPPAGGNEGGSGNTVPLPNSPDDGVIGVPGDPSGVGGAVAGIGSVFFCAFVLVMLFIVFAVVRSTARGRMGGGTVYGPTLPPVPPVIDPDPFGMGRGRRRRRRYGGYGGSMFPPIFIPPPSPPRQWNDGRDSSPFDGGSGGGGSFWGDSGGGGSSWGSSGGGGSSWGGGGGGGSSWGGGGGSSGGGGGSGGGSGGGGGGSFG